MQLILSQEEKDFLLSKAMKDLKAIDPKTFTGSGFWMLTGSDESTLYEVTFKVNKLPDHTYKWEINTVKIWD